MMDFLGPGPFSRRLVNLIAPPALPAFLASSPWGFMAHGALCSPVGPNVGPWGPTGPSSWDPMPPFPPATSNPQSSFKQKM